ncbi:MAG: transposase Tn3 family protein [Rhizobium sp.]|nr:transposase Tn3 family protein [Rhizobium sp.]
MFCNDSRYRRLAHFVQTRHFGRGFASGQDAFNDFQPLLHFQLSAASADPALFLPFIILFQNCSVLQVVFERIRDATRTSMTKKQREALQALPENEEEVVRHSTLGADDLAAIGKSRTPEIRSSFALQPCCLRYPGRNLQLGPNPSINRAAAVTPRWMAIVNSARIVNATSTSIKLSPVFWPSLWIRMPLMLSQSSASDRVGLMTEALPWPVR